MHKRLLLKISLFAIWPMILIFRIPLEHVFLLSTYGWIMFFGFCSYAYTAFESIRSGIKWQKMAVLAVALFVLVIFYSDFSKKLFLGQEIGVAFVAESPGYMALKVYEEECTIEYGGIFGFTDIFYCDYEIKNGIFWIFTNERNLYFERSMFMIKGQELEIRRKSMTIKTIILTECDKERGEKISYEDVINPQLPIPEFVDFKKYCETSGVLLNSKWTTFRKPSDKGRIGFYTLFNEGRKQNMMYEYIGELVVFAPNDKNWRFNDPNQTFLGIRLQMPGIKLFGKIEVGKSVHVLKQVLREPNLKNDSLTVYHDSNGTLGIFKVKKDTITEIYYGLMNLDNKEPLAVEDAVLLINTW